MTFEDKATGSDSLSKKKKKTLIERAKAPALHSLLLMCDRYICSIDEELSETDRRDQGPSIIVLNKPVEASNLTHSWTGLLQEGHILRNDQFISRGTWSKGQKLEVPEFSSKETFKNPECSRTL